MENKSTTKKMVIQGELEEKKILEKIVEISEEFLQSVGSEINYQKITDDILYISGAKYAAFNLYEEDGRSFRTIALSASKGVIKKLTSPLGFKLIGKKWDPDPIRTEKIKSHIITHFSTLSELVGDIIPKHLLSLLEKTFNIREVIFVNIIKENVMIGDFNLIMPRNVKFKNDNYVEIYTRQVGLLIARSRSEAKLIESETRFKTIFNDAPLGIALIDSLTGHIYSINPMFAKIAGRTVEEMADINWMSITHPDDVQKDLDNMALLNSGKINGFQMEKRYLHHDGTSVWINMTIAPVYVEDKAHPRHLCMIEDITERKNRESEIIHLGFHDYLTGLYNRRFVEEEIKRLNTKRQLPLSFVMGDLNGLKLINDTFGHSMGDKILKEIAELLKRICRSDDILARWGGDEFVILLPKTSITDSEEIVQRIKKECTKLIIQKIPLSLSIGIATKIEIDQDIDEIIKEAESNMYRNKLGEKESNASSIIFALEQTLFEKSSETMEHATRIKDNAIKLGKSIKLHSSQLDELSLLASLHDIGKVAIPETILLKEGKLTEKEWADIKRHPEIGFNIAQASPQIIHIAKFILACHENWDGSGYPMGLAKESIPLLSRIMLIVDAYDVMTSERIYKKTMSENAAIEELKRCASTQFDPVLVEKFIEILSN